MEGNLKMLGEGPHLYYERKTREPSNVSIDNRYVYTRNSKAVRLFATPDQSGDGSAIYLADYYYTH